MHYLPKQYFSNFRIIQDTFHINSLQCLPVILRGIFSDAVRHQMRNHSVWKHVLYVREEPVAECRSTIFSFGRVSLSCFLKRRYITGECNPRKTGCIQHTKTLTLKTPQSFAVSIGKKKRHRWMKNQKGWQWWHQQNALCFTQLFYIQGTSYHSYISLNLLNLYQTPLLLCISRE